MITRVTVIFAMLVMTTLVGCGFDRGRIEGHIEYIDSNWDPEGPPGQVPNLMVYILPGTETKRREILTSFEPVVARGIPGEDVPGLVEHIKVWHTETGEILKAQEVGPDGSFAFARLPKGSYLVFADYNTDLGYFGWLLHTDVDGTRTSVVEMEYENRLPIVMPPERYPSPRLAPTETELPTVEPTAPLEVEVPADKVPEVLEKLGMADATP